jgi:hypothetical protein
MARQNLGDCASIAQRVLASRKSFTFFHTWTVSEDLLSRAIREEKSMDLDVCVDDLGNPYLGHSREYHEKTGEAYFNSLPLWGVIERIVTATIVVMIDCKHYGAWPIIEEIVDRIGPHRCLVSSFVSELKFGHNRADGEPDFLAEWISIEKLFELKRRFPAVTANACAKWPPKDLLMFAKYENLVEFIRHLLKAHRIDTVCLGVPFATITDRWLNYFLSDEIIPHIEIDRAETTRLTQQVYIGETDSLERASNSPFAIGLDSRTAIPEKRL